MVSSSPSQNRETGPGHWGEMQINCSMMDNLTERTQLYKWTSVNKRKAPSQIQQPPDQHLSSDPLFLAATAMPSAFLLPAPGPRLYSVTVVRRTNWVEAKVSKKLKSPGRWSLRGGGRGLWSLNKRGREASSACVPHLYLLCFYLFHLPPLGISRPDWWYSRQRPAWATTLGEDLVGKELLSLPK